VGRECGPVITKAAIGFLTFSRYGLSDNELMDLLTLRTDVAVEVYGKAGKFRPPFHCWLRVRSRLGDLLVDGPGGRILWTNKKCAEWSASWFSDEERRGMCRLMAEYFGNLLDKEETSRLHVMRHKIVLSGGPSLDESLLNRRRCQEAAVHMFSSSMLREARAELCRITSVYAYAKTHSMCMYVHYLGKLAGHPLLSKDARVIAYYKWLRDGRKALFGPHVRVTDFRAHLSGLGEGSILASDIRGFLVKYVSHGRPVLICANI